MKGALSNMGIVLEYDPLMSYNKLQVGKWIGP